MRCRWLVLLFHLPVAVAAFSPVTGDLAREVPDSVRVVSWNLQGHFPDGTAGETASIDRILAALNPDILALQEIPSSTSFQTIRTRLAAVLGGSWQAWLGDSAGTRNALCSKYPVTMVRTDTEPASDARGVTMGLIDLPDGTYQTDLYLMVVHFKCCSGGEEDARRQRHADAIAHWIGDIKTPGGAIDLPDGTPLLIAGDVNISTSGSQSPHVTLLTGDIQDEVTFGPDVTPDWDGTNLGEALPADPWDLDIDTWSSASGSPTQRFDRFYFTDSAATVLQAIVLNTASMNAGQLSSAGLNAADSADAADHLAILADLALPGQTVTVAMPGDLGITEIMPNPSFVSDNAGEWFEVYNRTAQPIDLNGWLLRDLGGDFHFIDHGGPLPVPSRTHVVLGNNSNGATNGGVPVSYSYEAGMFLANTEDEIELYRGTRKIDGIQWLATAPPGDTPDTVWRVGAITVGASIEMHGPYTSAPTSLFGDSTSFYNEADRGTPGALNSGWTPDPTSDWWLFEQPGPLTSLLLRSVMSSILRTSLAKRSQRTASTPASTSLREAPSFFDLTFPATKFMRGPGCPLTSLLLRSVMSSILRTSLAKRSQRTASTPASTSLREAPSFFDLTFLATKFMRGPGCARFRLTGRFRRPSGTR